MPDVNTDLHFAPPPVAGQVEIIVYADDVLVQGRVIVPTTRLTDLMTMTTAITVRDCTATVLADDRILHLPELEVPRAELIGLSMAGPRGDADARVEADVRRLVIVAGPYRIAGHAHVPPQLDAIAHVRGLSVLPLTDVNITYELHGQAVHAELPGLILIVERADSIAEVELPVDGPGEATQSEAGTALVTAHGDGETAGHRNEEAARRRRRRGWARPTVPRPTRPRSQRASRPDAR
jgi:hypothetical protein